jgi:hypothetical protein
MLNGEMTATCDGCGGPPPLNADGNCSRCVRLGTLGDPVAHLAFELRGVWEDYVDAIAHHIVDGNGRDLAALRDQVDSTEREIRQRVDELLAQLEEA